MTKLLPPTLVALLAVMMIGVTFVAPWPGVVLPVRFVGTGVFVAGLMLSARHAALFERVGTNIMTFDDPGTLVRTGAFAWTRNPMYPDVVTRISLIVVSKRAGFSLGETARILAPGAFDEGKHLLESKLDELRRRRVDLDAAIAGIEHAIACPAPSPVECEHFRATLPDVLPVDATG